jgi:hypothetical protein
MLCSFLTYSARFHKDITLLLVKICCLQYPYLFHLCSELCLLGCESVRNLFSGS